MILTTVTIVEADLEETEPPTTTKPTEKSTDSNNSNNNSGGNGANSNNITNDNKDKKEATKPRSKTDPYPEWPPYPGPIFWAVAPAVAWGMALSHKTTTASSITSEAQSTSVGGRVDMVRPSSKFWSAMWSQMMAPACPHL